MALKVQGQGVNDGQSIFAGIVLRWYVASCDNRKCVCVCVRERDGGGKEKERERE